MQSFYWVTIACIQAFFFDDVGRLRLTMKQPVLVTALQLSLHKKESFVVFDHLFEHHKNKPECLAHMVTLTIYGYSRMVKLLSGVTYVNSWLTEFDRWKSYIFIISSHVDRNDNYFHSYCYGILWTYLRFICNKRTFDTFKGHTI